jgi:restriction system protein
MPHGDSDIQARRKREAVVARPSLRRERAERRRAEAAVKLILFGVALVLAPAFFGKAFNALIPVGLIMLVAGGIFVWVGRRSPPTTNLPTPRAPGHRPDRRIEPTAGGLDEIREIFEVESPRSRADRTPTDAPRPTSWSPEVFNVIEWRRFEAVVEVLFQQAGFETRSQSHGADDGIDVWLYSRNHSGSPVSRRSVQALVRQARGRRQDP